MGQKLEIVRGTSRSFGISVKNKETGHPYTLEVGETLVFGLKKSPRDKKCVLLKPITHTVNGEYYLELTPADTANLEYGLYHYDVGLQVGATVLYNVIEWSDFLIKPNAVECGDVLWRFLLEKSARNN